MRIEEIYFYKLILLCGYPEELNKAISTALDHQNPIESDILDLSACRGDVKKQLSVLNAILARNGEDLLDRKVIFELVRRFLHQQYVAGMDISTLVKLMYRISKETGWHDEEPWNSLFLMEDYYDDAQWGINGMEDFRHQLECLLTPTSFEHDCAVPISAIKQQLILYEQQGMRLPVYRYLKDLWNTSFRTEDLTVLIMQQMMFYLIELESPWVTWETEDEHQTYQSFLHEALAYDTLCAEKGAFFTWNLEDKMHYAQSLPVKLAAAEKSGTHPMNENDLVAIANYGFCLPTAECISQDDAYQIAVAATSQEYGLPEGWEAQSEVYYSFFFKPETGYTWRVIFWKTGNASYPSGVVDLDALTGDIIRIDKNGTMPNEYIPWADRI